jgi:hypothetical protein
VGVYAKYTGTGSGGYAVYAEATQRGTGVYGLSPAIAVVGQNSISNTFGGLGWGNAGAYGTGGSNTGGYLGTGRAGVEGLDWDIHSGKYGVYAESDNGTGLYSIGGRGAYSAEFQGNILIRGRDTGNPVIELGEGLDYAEGFDVSEANEIEPGTVLIIDPDNPGKLTISDQAYDFKVAGIVAGAQGQGSGVRLGVDQFDYDVALAGRVYCNVDATDAAVEPGDLLTTSATPGYAMKVTDYSRAQGAILGKAMERLEKGEKGQILVLVTLQ